MYDVEKIIRIRKGVEEISGVDDTYRELISFCKSRKRIFLFGTEQFGMYFYELLRKQGIVPHGFIDIDPNKTAIDQHKFPVLFRHFEEIDFKNEASEIGVIISCPRDLHGLAVRRLPIRRTMQSKCFTKKKFCVTRLPKPKKLPLHI